MTNPYHSGYILLVVYIAIYSYHYVVAIPGYLHSVLDHDIMNEALEGKFASVSIVD